MATINIFKLQSPLNIRMACRDGLWQNATTGLALGFLQTNLAVLPRSMADDFAEFCALNYGPLPLLYRSAPGETGAPPLAKDSDVRTDVPMYQVLVGGILQSTPSNLLEYPWEDMVSFYLGCSFSFEEALSNAGVRVRNVEEKKNVAMFNTNIDLLPVGRFGGKMVVSMRPVKVVDLPLVVKVTMELPSAHGGPIHIGEPEKIGIADINNPDFGESIDIKDDEVPVFWACGVTTFTALQYAAPGLCFTHKPGSMYVSDILVQEWEKSTPTIPLQVIPVTPSFFSYLGASAAEQVAAIQEAVLPPSTPVPGEDLLKSVLALSHCVGGTVLVTLDSEPDCLLSAVALVMALGLLNTGVHFVCPGVEWAAIEECIAYCVAERILSCTDTKPTHSCTSAEGLPNSGCLVVLGAPAAGTACTSMDAVQRLSSNTPLTIAVTKITEDNAVDHPALSTALKVAANSVAAGGLALAAGLCAVSQCPVQWRYRNHATGEKTPQKAAAKAFFPTDNQADLLMQFLSKQSSHRSGKNEQSPKYLETLNSVKKPLTVA